MYKWNGVSDKGCNYGIPKCQHVSPTTISDHAHIWYTQITVHCWQKYGSALAYVPVHNMLYSWCCTELDIQSSPVETKQMNNTQCTSLCVGCAYNRSHAVLVRAMNEELGKTTPCCVQSLLGMWSLTNTCYFSASYSALSSASTVGV